MVHIKNCARREHDDLGVGNWEMKRFVRQHPPVGSWLIRLSVDFYLLLLLLRGQPGLQSASQGARATILTPADSKPVPCDTSSRLPFSPRDKKSKNSVANPSLVLAGGWPGC